MVLNLVEQIHYHHLYKTCLVALRRVLARMIVVLTALKMTILRKIKSRTRLNKIIAMHKRTSSLSFWITIVQI